jgi:hypothetical protein
MQNRISETLKYEPDKYENKDAVCDEMSLVEIKKQTDDGHMLHKGRCEMKA